MTFYYNVDTEKYVVESDVWKDWKELYSDEYDNFQDYLNACFTYNNGSLESLRTREIYLKREMRKLMNSELFEPEDIEYHENELKTIAILEKLEKEG